MWACCTPNHTERGKRPPAGVVRKIGEGVCQLRSSSSSDHDSKRRDCYKTSSSFQPEIKPVFRELEGKHTNHYTGRGYTRWDRRFIKSFPTSILREWFLKRFERKCFREQPMESEMATFPQPSLLSEYTVEFRLNQVSNIGLESHSVVLSHNI
ncbi:hypothetical protein AVEN_248705-1 [Araneus ventricosus]|uniref:Uncharacterized protein n=1 Tax=Araneus ventricosus TaxID=182803 RepID=A0A4Y2MG32_ARAVE|nr:hypothetical protein AVEN_248705-1 [Araneus ventricosus]